MGEYDVKYVVQVDDTEAQKKLKGLGDSFSEAFNAGRNFEGTKKELQDMIQSVQNALKQMQAEQAQLQRELSEAPTKSAKSRINRDLKEVQDDISATKGQLAGLQDKLKELNQNKQPLDGIVSGARGIMGAFTAASGAVALFGGEQKDLQKVQTKLQASMSILMGLQQISNTLQSTSTFRTQILNRALDAWRAMNLKVAASEGVKKLAMAGVAGLIAAAIVGIGALIVKLSKSNEELEKAKKLQEEFKKEYQSTYASQMQTYTKLQAQWKATNGDLQQQEIFIRKNKSAFDALGQSIHSVKDAERLLSGDVEEFKSAIKKKAEIAAEYAKLMKLVDEDAEATAAGAERENRWNTTGKIYGSDYGLDLGQRIAAWVTSDAWYSWLIKTSGKTSYSNRVKTIAELNHLTPVGTQGSAKRQQQIDEQIDKIFELLKEGNPDINDGDKEEFQKYVAARIKAAKEGEKQLGRTIEDMEYSLSQAKEEAIEDSVEKDLRNMEAAHQRRLAEIARERVDIEKKMEEQAKKEWLAANPLADESNWDSAAWKPTQEQQEWLNSYFTEKEKAENDRNFLQIENYKKKYLESYADYVLRYKKIYDDADRERKNILTLGFDEETQNRMLSTLNKTTNKNIAALANDLGGSFEDADFTKWFKGLQKFNLNELKIELAEFKSALETIGDTEGSLEAVTETLSGLGIELAGSGELTEDQNIKIQLAIALLEELIKKYDLTKTAVDATTGTFVDWTNRIEAARNAFKELGAELSKSSNKVVQNLGAFSVAIGNTLADLQQLRNDMEAYRKASADLEKAKSTYTEGTAQYTAATTAAKSAMTAATINAYAIALSSLLKWIGNIIDAYEEAKKAEKEWAANQLEVANNLAMLRIEAKAYQESNIFGVDNPYAKAIAAADQYRESLEALQELSAKWDEQEIQTGVQKGVNWKQFWAQMGEGAIAGAVVGTAAGGWAMGIGTAIGAGIGAIIGGATALLSTEVKPIMEHIKSVYGELYDENYELNEGIRANYNNLDAEAKEIVDNWEKIKEKMKEAEEQMREAFKSLVGTMGDDLADALMSGFQSGGVDAAMTNFKKKIDDMLGAIIQQQLFSDFFKDIFDDLTEDMKNSMLGLDADYDIMDDVLEASDKINERAAAYLEVLKQTQQAFAEDGIYLWSQERTAAAKAISGVSQDSFNVVLGIATNLQIHTFSLVEGVTAIRAQNDALHLRSAEMLLVLQGIHSDTQSLRSEVQAMRGDMQMILSDVSTISDKGVIMRS